MDVDSEDLLREFESVAERVLTELKTKRTAQGVLSVSEDQKVAAIEKRLEAMQRSEKNVAYTLEQILNYANGKQILERILGTPLRAGGGLQRAPRPEPHHPHDG